MAKFMAYTPSGRPLGKGIIIREDWLNNLKLKKPTNLNELYEVLKAFTYGDPDRDGKDDTIGLTDRNDLVFGSFKTISSYFGTPNNWGVVGREARTGVRNAGICRYDELHEEAI